MAEVESTTEANEPSGLTINDFYQKLSEKVSAYNAKLLLHSVMVSSGLQNDKDSQLNKDEVKVICLELIKKGGPAFSVGKTIYGQIQ